MSNQDEGSALGSVLSPGLLNIFRYCLEKDKNIILIKSVYNFQLLFRFF